MTLLLIVISVTFLLLFLARKRSKPAPKDSGVGAVFGIEATDEEVEQERAFLDGVTKKLEERIIASGFFKRERIPELVAILKKGSKPFARINTDVAFEGSTYLTVDEKRNLGLNTRMKYSHEFVAYFDPRCLKTMEPKSALACMHRDSYNREHRKKLLRKYRASDYITHVDISTIPGDACAQVNELRKRHAIGAAPDLPLSHCDSECCGCTFLAVIPDEE